MPAPLGPVVRRITADHWREWRALRLRALGEDVRAFGSSLADWTGPGDLEERWRGRLSLPGACDLLADLDGGAVGMGTGLPCADDASRAELISMWVAPEARARGVGRAVVEAVLAWAARAGVCEVRLAVADDNGAATALYGACGFRFTGELGDLMPDGVRRERVMSRSVRGGLG